MKRLVLMAATSIVFCATAHAGKLTYLNCDFPAKDGNPGRHFEFTLDEENSTVSFRVKTADVDAIHSRKAMFGPETIVWTDNTEYSTSTRTLDRVDLTFIEDSQIGEKTFHDVAPCRIVTPRARAF